MKKKKKKKKIRVMMMMTERIKAVRVSRAAPRYAAAIKPVV
jgi:hypothetical protein